MDLRTGRGILRATRLEKLPCVDHLALCIDSPMFLKALDTVVFSSPQSFVVGKQWTPINTLKNGRVWTV